MNRSKIILLNSLHLPLIIESLRRRLCLRILKTLLLAVRESVMITALRLPSNKCEVWPLVSVEKCSCPQHPQTCLHDLQLQLLLQPPSPSSLIVIESPNCVSILSALFSYSISTSSSRRVVIPRKKS